MKILKHQAQNNNKHSSNIDNDVAEVEQLYSVCCNLN
jgi:hypothetical protein